MLIRDALTADLAAINEIYNHYVRTCTCTFQTVPSTAEERREWFDTHEQGGEKYPVLVAEESGVVVGWASLNQFHRREAYRYTVEDSVYVHPQWQRRGIGGALLTQVLARGDLLGFRETIAVISADQAGSLALHQRHGFRQAGVLRRVGYKFERWLDVVYLQRSAGG